MTQEQGEQNIVHPEHRPHGPDCGHCNGDPDAEARQRKMMERQAKVEELVVQAGNQLKESARAVRQVVNLSGKLTWMAEQVDRGDSVLSDLMQRNYHTREESERTELPSLIPADIRGRAAGAAAIALSQVATISPAAAVETDQPKPFDLGDIDTRARVREFEPLEQSVLDQATFGLSLKAPTAEKSNVVESTETEKQIPVDAQESEGQEIKKASDSDSNDAVAEVVERVEPLEPGITIVLGKQHPNMLKILSQVTNKNIQPGDETVTIKSPKVAYLEPGQNPTHLAKHLLGPEHKDDRSAVNRLANLIMDMNEIDTSPDVRNDQLISPNDPLFIPVETPVIDSHNEESVDLQANTDEQQDVIPESDSEQKTDEVTVTVQRDTKSDLKQLEESIRTVEKAHINVEDGLSIEELQDPSPIADEIAKRASTIFDEVEAGRTNVAAIQSEAIIELVMTTDGLTLDEAAKEIVVAQFAGEDIEAPDEVVEQAAVELIGGIMSQEAPEISPVDAEAVVLDDESKTVAEIKAEITDLKFFWQEEVRNAKEDLADFGIETPEADFVTKKLVELDLNDELKGDSYFYLLLDNQDIQTSIKFVREDLPRAVFADLGAERLLDEVVISAKYNERLTEVLGSDMVVLEEYVNELEKDVFDLTTKGEKRVVPVVAEVTGVVGGDEVFSDEFLNDLRLDGALNVTDDFLRMRILGELAAIREQPLREVVKDYYQEAFKFAELEDVISASQIDELVAEAVMVWETDGFEQKLVTIDATKIIDAITAEGLRDLHEVTKKYTGVNLEDLESADMANLVKDFLRNKEESSAQELAFIFALTQDHEKVDAFLYDYYEKQEADYYIRGDGIIPALSDYLTKHPEASPADYTEKLAIYTTNPEEIFPDGKQFTLTDYDGRDLTEFFKAAGWDSEMLLDDPLNAHLKAGEDGIIAQQGTVWLADGSVFDERVVKKAYDELIRDITPPGKVELPPEPEIVEPKPEAEPVNDEDGKSKEKDSKVEKPSEKVETSQATTLDQLLERGPLLESYEKFASYKWDADGSGAPDHPLLKEMWNDWSSIDHAKALIRFKEEGWINFDKGVQSVLNDIAETGYSYTYGNDGDDFDRDDPMAVNRNLMRTLTISAALVPDGKFYIMNLSDGGHINKSNHFMDRRSGEPVYGLVNAVDLGKSGHDEWLDDIAQGLVLNEDLIGGFREFILGHPNFKDERNHGKPHVSSDKTRKGHSGNNLHVHGSFMNVMVDKELPSVEEKKAKEEAAQKAAEEKALAEKQAKEEKEKKAKEEAQKEKEKKEESGRPPGISKEQLVVSQAKTVDELVELGYTSLAKIPKADQKAFNEVLAQMPTIETAFEKYNYRQGGSKGPRMPASAVLAIAYDAGLRGDELIEAATTGRGESIGFHPYIIGDDKGERNNGEPTRFATGLFQFFMKNDDGISDSQYSRGEVLLHPVANILEAIEYIEQRGFQPWYFNQNKDKQPEQWNAHKDKVLAAAVDLDDGGINILP